MTDEAPAGDPARRARPPRGMRQVMLTGDVDGDTPAGQPAAVPEQPRSLVEALAAIPDIERESSTGAWPQAEPIPADHAGWSGAGSSTDTVARTENGSRTAASTIVTPTAVPRRDAPRDDVDGGYDDGAYDDGGYDGGARGRRARRRVPGERRPVPWYRRALFAVVVVALVAAVPVLAWMGVKLIRDSKGGTYAATSSNPSEPGYEALVEPTPTALVVQRNADGTPNSLTFLSLGDTKGGGSVMFIPLDTKVLQPLPNVDRLRTAYEPASKPVKAEASLSRYTALTLGVGFTDTIGIDDADWEELLAKVAPIEIQNPDALTVGTVPLAAGTVALQANQIGPYLAASVPGESDLNRLNRHEILWRAIVAKVAASEDPDILPGETGLAPYLRALADGVTTYQTMPVTQSADATTFTIREDDLDAAVLEQVPFPQSPIPGARPAVRVLDGVSANPDGAGLTQPLVAAGATIAVVGNGPEFGQETTVWSYGEERDKDDAVLLRALLGGKGKVVHDPRIAEVADVSVIVGKDLHDQLVKSSAAATTTTATTTTVPPTTAAAGGFGDG